MIFAWKALRKLTPHVFFETTGCAFTFLVAKFLAGCRVATYVHYPTISTDMLSLVWERRPTYNNNASIAGSSFVTYVKLCYYSVFAVAYGLVGSLADVVMVNSSWTLAHIRYMWKFGPTPVVVFPPCDTTKLASLSITKKRDPIVLSIGQFRPEKDHALQIRSFARLMKRWNEGQKKETVKLVLIGGCRNKDDEALVGDLKKLSEELGISDCTEFLLNQPYSVLLEWFGKASVGIHTMWNEHFGIGVVEMMAAGMITIAHNSGGPRADIIATDANHRSGYLASTEEEYANCIYEALVGEKSKITIVRKRGQESAGRFSEEAFEKSFIQVMAKSKILQ
eukprot:CAMPEP_0118683028 /NCGR_PEP_ID=MMETSP0800-20121206/5808_1 /TAXON_ID=210618 ORGANISM="Striatella unipunctata, Strain CCMP2910" /NCGR_SAMPLE_ID=MMETSP0800 /ASSEMBLY_ACC=CAM_ASM_000638 /LENGTH=336 /DNA_ID=CAMNT_0006579473 /DNA_START=169 /DNA_END=1179 /DNA_ORIENTATION=+